MVSAFHSHLSKGPYYKLRVYWKKHQKNDDFSKGLDHTLLTTDSVRNSLQHTALRSRYLSDRISSILGIDADDFVIVDSPKTSDQMSKKQLLQTE